MRNGAADYLMKDQLGRIGEAVRHALEQQRLQKEHAAAQQEIEERTSALVASHHALQALASEPWRSNGSASGWQRSCTIIWPKCWRWGR